MDEQPRPFNCLSGAGIVRVLAVLELDKRIREINVANICIWSWTQHATVSSRAAVVDCGTNTYVTKHIDRSWDIGFAQSSVLVGPI